MSLAIQPRITDNNVIQQIRQESGGLCEYVDPATGRNAISMLTVNFIILEHVVLGGSDIRENLIYLCGVHNTMFQDGNLNRHHLIVVVAEREGKTVEEIYDTLKLLLPEQPEPIQRKGSHLT